MSTMFGEEELKLVSHRPSPHQLMNGNGIITSDSIVCSDERHSSVDRSMSGTPSQTGDEHPQELEEDNTASALGDELGSRMDDDVSSDSMKRDIHELQKGLIFMSHQMSRIMKALHVPPCMCDVCSIRHIQLNGARSLEDPTPVLSALFPTATPEQLNSLAALAAKVPAQQRQPSSQQFVSQLGQNYAGLNAGGKISCTTDKRLVADYAKVHGGLAAAKKFGVVPPVSSYYQRKDSSQTLGGTANTSPGPSSEGENDIGDNNCTMPVLQPSQTISTNGQPTQLLQQQGAARQNVPVSTSVSSSPMFPPSMMDMMKMNAAHSTGSPGFLRGRGRGRPKLIGDELDADLVDYMVSVKQADPSGHLTASQALTIAKQYILDRAPGLLEEHGGHVKLKLTWAMKLVSRISERQKEMELGLPAGTLSNLGRQQLNNLPGGNLMADIMAQNILSQHMIMGNLGNAQGNTGSNNSTQQKKDDNPSSVDMEETTGAAEIVNVKELNLKFLKSLFEGGVTDEMAGITEGEIPFNDENELTKADESTGEELTISSRA